MMNDDREVRRGRRFTPSFINMEHNGHELGRTNTMGTIESEGVYQEIPAGKRDSIMTGLMPEFFEPNLPPRCHDKIDGSKGSCKKKTGDGDSGTSSMQFDDIGGATYSDHIPSAFEN